MPFGNLILLLCKTWATFCHCFVHQHGHLITWVKTKNTVNYAIKKTDLICYCTSVQKKKRQKQNKKHSNLGKKQHHCYLKNHGVEFPWCIDLFGNSQNGWGFTCSRWAIEQQMRQSIFCHKPFDCYERKNKILDASDPTFMSRSDHQAEELSQGLTGILGCASKYVVNLSA